MSRLPEFAVVDGRRLGAWVVDGLADRAGTVGAWIPRGFEAYARVFGSGDEHRLFESISEVLGGCTDRSGTCYCGFYIGFSWTRTTATPSGVPNPDPVIKGSVLGQAERFDPEAALHLLSLPPDRDREYWVVETSLEEAKNLHRLRGAAEISPRAPNLMWPGDRSWFVSTEVDLDFTLVGGSSALIQALPATGEMEVAKVGWEDSLTRSSR